jgi:hypothetical protein
LCTLLLLRDNLLNELRVQRRWTLHRSMLLLKPLLLQYAVLTLLLSDKSHLCRSQLPLLRYLSLNTVCECSIVESRILAVETIRIGIARLTVEAHPIRIGIEGHPNQSTYILFAYNMSKEGL